ncbi:hypothetical protein BOTBODRAFT_343542 [Botryobasidium botryosum FD-172 SS1]|uniref:Transmembrane protein n=1 Tax=Botryobasidium botryosum (strain FD-172 SS1) TaxID=930990 RepID=A0A067MIE3_BOTB1|nr:hypothetical protein BOTBODRAFT_343542 [Botryobasidium botryosum FD-172 SS1]
MSHRGYASFLAARPSPQWKIDGVFHSFIFFPPPCLLLDPCFSTIGVAILYSSLSAPSSLPPSLLTIVIPSCFVSTATFFFSASPGFFNVFRGETEEK